ncbi:MAG: hypothetical protein IJ223_02150 [Clostridia bacterium]|nr:hypothetical protein [Clostridia bacterium]
MQEYQIPVQENNGGELAEVSVWSRIKSFLFQEIKVELTPAQQGFEDKLNNVLGQEVTFKSFKDFLFQEIKF